MQTTDDLLAQIRAHGERTYPEECCGFLLGEASPEGNCVTAIRPVENRQETNRERRYVITPRDYMEAERAAAREGMDVVGIYHSHPDHPARPSATDLAEATFPGYTYVIVTVQQRRAAELTAWSLAPNRSRFDAESVELREPAPAR